MKNYRTLSRKQLALTGCILALFAAVAVVPWRVVAQEAKEGTQKEAQPAAVVDKAASSKTREELIVGTWRGVSPSPNEITALDDLLIEKDGDYVWLSRVQRDEAGAMEGGEFGAPGGMMPRGRGGMGGEGIMGGAARGIGRRGGIGMPPGVGGIRPRGGFGGEMGGGMMGGALPPGRQSTPFAQAGHWKLQGDGTLTLTPDTKVPWLRGLPITKQRAADALPEGHLVGTWRIIRLDASLLRLLPTMKQPDGGDLNAFGPVLFFRRIDDQEQRVKAAAGLPPDLRYLADLAHFNAEETKNFDEVLTALFGNDKAAVLEKINRIVAARQRKIDFAELFKLTPEEATAYLELLKLAGGAYSAVNSLAEQGQLSPTELAAVKKLKKFRTEYQTAFTVVPEALQKMKEEYDLHSQPSTPENEHPPADPAMLVGIRMMEKFETLLLEFDGWMNLMVFN